MEKMKLNAANGVVVSDSKQVGILRREKSFSGFPLTLLELKQPKTLVFYDYFNLEKAHFLQEEKSVLLEIKASFLEKLASLDMKVTFVEKGSMKQQVLGENVCDTVSNIINHTESLLVDVADICETLEANATKEILVILEAVFHHAEDHTTELQVTKQVNVWAPVALKSELSSRLTLDPTYKHIHPAKHSPYKCFPDDEKSKSKDDYIETQRDDLRDDECIVIALYREPSDVT